MKELKKSIDRAANEVIFELKVKTNQIELVTDSKGKIIIDDTIFNSKELFVYAFIVLQKVTNKSLVNYIGKSQNGARLRQHILNENKNGSPLKESVATKHKEIIASINQGDLVFLSIYKNKEFNKTLLSCIEDACIENLKTEGEAKWNKRNG